MQKHVASPRQQLAGRTQRPLLFARLRTVQARLDQDIVACFQEGEHRCSDLHSHTSQVGEQGFNKLPAVGSIPA
eukprot:1157583-Pelagomonas_calceolata.AAC.5